MAYPRPAPAYRPARPQPMGIAIPAECASPWPREAHCRTRPCPKEAVAPRPNIVALKPIRLFCDSHAVMSQGLVLQLGPFAIDHV